MKNLCATVFLIGLMALPAVAASDISGRDSHGNVVINKNFDKEEEAWKETEAELPAFPQDEALIKIYVSAVATHTYMVDPTTLQLGKDGVVRYVLVVRTTGGAQNISFEGIHCKELKWKLYATGQRDGTWAKARFNEWRPIENKPVNRYHAALSRDYFCPGGTSIDSADDGRNALRQGKHPRAL